MEGESGQTSVPPSPPSHQSSQRPNETPQTGPTGSEPEKEQPHTTTVAFGEQRVTQELDAPTHDCSGQETPEIESSPPESFCDGSQYLEESIDLDLDKFSGKLDKHVRALKKDMTSFFVEARNRQKSRSRNELVSERNKFDRALGTKQEEILLLQEEASVAKKSIKSLYSTLSRFAEALARANDNKRVARKMVLCFHKWKEFAAKEIHIRRMLKKALWYYDSEFLKRRVVNSWKEWARSEQRQHAKERAQNRIDLAREEIETEYRTKLNCMEEEMSVLRVRLEEEGRARDLLEEDMKQAFMRGVCALNLEALSVMKRGVPPGANPVPISFPETERTDSPEEQG
ncbi:hypothetical protein BSKO_07735 [Bryopsis sp. KO-2023]|nr:hypothetical protein BSKO_07735 [Bryopsis sp. KO-2023]